MNELPDRLSPRSLSSTVGAEKSGAFLFEDRRSTDAGTLLFEGPVCSIRATTAAEIKPALAQIEAAQAEGYWVAGYIGFEAGYALEPRLADLPPLPAGSSPLPLIDCGVFREPEALTPAAADLTLPARASHGHKLHNLTPRISRASYEALVARALELINAGDIYQVNLTFPLEGLLEGDPFSLYLALRARQPVAHGAFLALGDASAVLSLSPELFITRRGQRLITRPMKGTIARGVSTRTDALAEEQLRNSAKDRAENLMIVDLLRNDLSRVCHAGSVEVTRLFDLETYPTLHTLTSTIEGDLREGIGFAAIMGALFPCGSVTGAPKIRAMEVIRNLETHARGPYTGAIGWLAPHGDFSFNVAIRTATVTPEGRLSYPVGAGIVADSVPAAEFDECLLKAAFLTAEAQPFELIETLAWHPESGFAYLEPHLTRMATSAAHFKFEWAAAPVQQALADAVKDASAPLRVRLTLSSGGTPAVTVTPLTPSTATAPLRAALAPNPVDAADPYLRHKTTRRAFFERELARAKEAHDCAEVLLVNQYGALTEGTWTNLFVSFGAGPLVTPPLEDGLLPGILRADLIAEGKAIEGTIRPKDLSHAAAIYMGNSVRGLMRTEIITSSTAEACTDQLASATTTG